MRSINPTEHQIQCAIVEWSKLIIFRDRKIFDFLLKISNEGKRSWITGKKMKKEGLKNGVSDMFLPICKMQPNGTFRGGLWIEIKSNNGVLAKEQDEWLKLMRENMYCSAVVRSVDQGIQAIKDYLGMK